MTVLKRGAVAAPVQPKETVPVPALGGDVVVRGLLLTEHLTLHTRIRAAAKDEANPDGANSVLPELLARCVIDADSLPLFTEAQWQIFGGKEAAQAVALFNVAWRLSGFDEAGTAKN